MASLLGQFFTSIRGSQEDIASMGMSYILERSNSARNIINNIIFNKTTLKFNNIRYITQNVGKNKERPDVSGLDEQGNEKIIIEAKFWASLTNNQPVEYLNRLNENAILFFICPKLRESSLFDEIKAKLMEANIVFKDNQKLIVLDNNKFIFIIDWMFILKSIKQALQENNENILVSDIDQIIGFCEIIDDNIFLPIQDSDLSPSIPRRISSYYDFLDKVYDKLKENVNARVKAETDGRGLLQSRGQKWGYSKYFMIDNYCITLELHFKFWQNIADTPFWIAINEEWGKPQTVDFKNKLGIISTKTGIRLYDNNINNLLYFALIPKLKSLSDILCKWQNIIRTEPVLFRTQWQTGLEPAPIPLSALSTFYWRYE